MAKIKELLKFKKESFFDGAVQADWFYEISMQENVSSSYIFHGPKYFGVSEKDINLKNHKLIDTVSFVNQISDKLYNDNKSSRFILTIAGYGAGKSHLAVTMASLFSGNDKKVQSIILDNIESVDESIGKKLRSTLVKPNLVIALNGMNDFNLNYEILKCTKKALKMYGLDDRVLEDMTTAYKTASKFIESTYDYFSERFLYYAKGKTKYSILSKSNLKQMLLKSLQEDSVAFEIVNEVYKEVNGTYIRWDEGISAGDILIKVNKIFCEEKSIFNKILIVFDEFGRFIEYAAAQPTIAGESALQQIFEAVQNANKNIVFIGLIQSDLNAYLARVENSNIVRYVGRYESSDKYYLSSNLETILANLVKKNDEKEFESKIGYVIEESYRVYHNKLFDNINRWFKQAKDKSVWSNKELYNKVILKGAYPLHPVTVWMLTNLSTWMQQRSTLTFVEEMYNQLGNEEVYNEGLTYIYPTELIKSKFFNELLNAEEKGMQQSQHCILYNDVITKYGDKLERLDKEILQGILITNIGKFATYDRSDEISALKYCTGHSEENISQIIKKLENEIGIIRYDDTIKRYEFLAEGSGLNDFKREFMRKKIRVSSEYIIESCDDEILRELTLDRCEETQFGMIHGINSQEWQFSKRFIDITTFNSSYVNNIIGELNRAIYSENPKGIVVWLYCNDETYQYIETVKSIIEEKVLIKYPIICLVINDTEGEIKNGLLDRKVLKEFNLSEREKYSKFINSVYDSSLKKIVSKFNDLAKKRYIITENGLETSELRLRVLCNNVFERIYTNPISFPFDGFEKKITTNVKKYFNSICVGLLANSITNKQGFQALPVDISNRAKAVLRVDNSKSWKVLLENCSLCEPQDDKIKKIYNNVVKDIEVGQIKNGGILFRKYLYPPYGMNMYSLSLFIAYFISYHISNINVYIDNIKVKNSIIAQKIFDDKKLNLEMLLKADYEYVEGSKADRYVTLLSKIESNIYVENCEEYNRMLHLLKQEEEIPNELEARVSAATMKLNVGLQKHAELYKKLNDAKQYLNETVEKKFMLSKAVKIFSMVILKEGKIENSDYYYNPKYNECCKNILEILDREIDKNIDGFIEQMRCDITQLSQFKGIYVNTAKILRDNGKVDYATRLESKVKQVEEEIKQTQKYQTLLVKFDQEVSFNGNNIDSKTYKELMKILDSIIGWKKYFQSLPGLNGSIKNSCNESLNKLRERIGSRIDELNCEINNLYDQIKDINDVDDLSDLRMKIEDIINKKVDREIEEDLKDKLRLINSFYADIDNLNRNKLERRVIDATISILKNNYKNTILENIVTQQCEDAITYLELMEGNWLKENVNLITNKVANMTPQECMTWRSKNASLPSYLSESSMEKFNVANNLVTERIKACKIDGIVSLFTELSEVDKKHCIKKLMEVM